MRGKYMGKWRDPGVMACGCLQDELCPKHQALLNPNHIPKKLGPRLAKNGKYSAAVAAELRQIAPILIELAEILENIQRFGKKQ